MSEEILKALMQLFAIIARQDNKVLDGHEDFVKDFLSSQLSLERTKEYLAIYNNFLAETKSETLSEKEGARVSMKDSVRTLAICRKINKTLAQKQKIIVLIRLLEFIQKDIHHSKNRRHILETVADVFNADKTEFGDITAFVYDKENSFASEIIIGNENEPIACKHFTGLHNYHGCCRFMYLKSINVVILKYHGQQELFLNGLVMRNNSVYLFPHGSTLRFPQTTVYFSSIISKFLEEHLGESFSFSADIHEHRFPNGWKALHHIKLEERSGHLVAIMGASGSGKTTLMTLMSGQEKPSDGNVRINALDVHQNKKELKGVIGYVPQDDLLIEDLTVYQNLYYNACLCFRELSEKEIALKATRTLLSLGLDEIRNIKVGNALNKKISGGQRKRLNIALELVREPHILFLDEPTSGLSSKDSENVLDLLKELTFKGKLVFVVIHQPSSDIFKMFDKVLFLDVGGFPVYYGNPIESVMYFKRVTRQINADTGECSSCGNVNPELVFNLIELKEIDEYGNYTAQRKIKPSEFHEFYREHHSGDPQPPVNNGKIESNLNIPGKSGQIKIFFLRDFYSKITNKQYLLISLLEVPVLAIILSLMIRFIDKSKSGTYSYYHNYNVPAYFFMAIIVALLVGLTISAEEIFKDQKILKREKFLHLSRFSYLVSKVLLLFSISIIQSTLFLLVGNLVLGIKDGELNFFLMLFSVFAFANLLGLVLSSTFNSPVTIYIIIPLVIIPQLLLGGALFSYDKLNALFGGGHKVPAVANTMVSRWAYEGLMTDMFVTNKYESQRYEYDKLESKLNYKLSYLIPFLEEQAAKFEKKHLLATLNEEYTEAKSFGFDDQAPGEDLQNTALFLKALNVFYTEKFAKISDLKNSRIAELIKKHGGTEQYNRWKEGHSNNRLEELVTGGMEKEKIVKEEGKIVQVIDPIYRDAEKSLLSLNAHFYSPVKFLFNVRVSTFAFNLLMIWMINCITFVLLYMDLPRKLLKRIS